MRHTIDSEFFSYIHVLAEPCFVQGGGGNFSVKHGNTMLVKASGFLFSEITDVNGWVVVDYKKIKSFYDNLRSAEETSEECGNEVVLKSIVDDVRFGGMKPSMETAFHAYLGKYVVHTHSIFVNTIACSAQSKQVCEDIFSQANFSFAWVPYANPGLHLAYAIKKLLEQQNKLPDVLVLENHGLIVHAQTVDGVRNIYTEVHELLEKSFGLGYGNYPDVGIVPLNADQFAGTTQFVKNYIGTSDSFVNEFTSEILFPDQAVFCNDIAEVDSSADNARALVQVSKKTGDIIYTCSRKQALTIEEEIAAWIFITTQQKIANLKRKGISPEDVRYITSMEMEKHRKNIIL